jgi:YesN/AraC family two-component response regulator
MENMDAMHYECFIRRAHQVARNGVAGADADAFRHLQKSYGHYKSEKNLADKGLPKQWNKPLDELAHDYAINSGKISAYVKTAIDHSLIKYANQLSIEKYKELENCKTLLISPTIESLVLSISKADEILLELKLFPK